MTPTETLRHEHQVILVALEAASREARAIEGGSPLAAERIEAMLDFFKNFADGCPYLRAVGEALAAARSGDGTAPDSIATDLGAYVELLRAHIAKEDNVLFPMADQILTPDDQEALERAFERVESEEIGKEVHEKYRRLARDLAGGAA